LKIYQKKIDFVLKIFQEAETELALKEPPGEEPLLMMMAEGTAEYKHKKYLNNFFLLLQ
jgi:hypothetical protein